jgi:arylsulfatase A-like enzyme
MFPPHELPPLHAGKEALEAKGFKWRFARSLAERPNPDYELELPRVRSNYFGMLRLIDDQLSRMFAYLEKRGLRENTLIFVLSDHGDFVGEYGLIRKGPEVPEMLMRIPFFVLGPEIAASAEPHPAHISLVDIFPTICEAVGSELPRGVQGRSLWPLLTGRDYPQEEFRSVYGEQGFGGLHYSDRDDIDYNECSFVGRNHGAFDELYTYSQSGTMRMVRKERWKLAYDMMGQGQLYDLQRDPYELNNLFGRPDMLEVQSDMLAELATWLLRMQDPLPYPVDKYIMKSDPRNYWTIHKR